MAGNWEGYTSFMHAVLRCAARGWNRLFESCKIIVINN